jgi:hypothetical protein
MRVESVKAEGPGVVSLYISGRHLDRLHARAGQFFLSGSIEAFCRSRIPIPASVRSWSGASSFA